LKKRRGKILQEDGWQISYSDFAWIPTDLKGITTIYPHPSICKPCPTVLNEGFWWSPHSPWHHWKWHSGSVWSLFGIAGVVAAKWNYVSKNWQMWITASSNIINARASATIRTYLWSAEMTVPLESSKKFQHQKLQKSIPDKNRLSFVSYSGWRHIDPILEGPRLDADQLLHQDLFNDWVGRWTSSAFVWPVENPIIIKDRSCPQLMIQATCLFQSILRQKYYCVSIQS
jgi:hypothetical protein